MRKIVQLLLVFSLIFFCFKSEAEICEEKVKSERLETPAGTFLKITNFGFCETDPEACLHQGGARCETLISPTGKILFQDLYFGDVSWHGNKLFVFKSNTLYIYDKKQDELRQNQILPFSVGKRFTTDKGVFYPLYADEAGYLFFKGVLFFKNSQPVIAPYDGEEKLKAVRAVEADSKALRLTHGLIDKHPDQSLFYPDSRTFVVLPNEWKIAQAEKKAREENTPPTMTRVDKNLFTVNPPNPFEQFKNNKLKNKGRQKFTLPVISPRKGESALQAIKRDFPKAYEELNKIKWQWKLSLTKEKLAEYLARFTQELEGMVFTGDLEQKTPLQKLIKQIVEHADYFTPEIYEIILETSLRSIKLLTNKSLHGAFHFSGICFFLGYRLGGTDQKDWPSNNPDLLIPLAKMYLDLAERNIMLYGEDELAYTYGWLTDYQQTPDWPRVLEIMTKAVIEFENIDKGLHDSAFDFILRAMNLQDMKAGETLLSRLDKAIGLALYFAQTLKQRGEKQIGAIIWNVDYKGFIPTEAKIKLWLELHKHYNIGFISRLQENAHDFFLTYELLGNLKPTRRAEDPVALVLMHRKGDFMFDTFSINDFTTTVKKFAKGYKLMIFSVSSEDEIKAAIRKTQYRTGKKISLLMLAGHGSQHTITFGHDGWEEYQNIKNGRDNYLQETMFLDTSDLDVMSELDKAMDKKGTLISYSCATCKGESSEVNIANTLAFHLPGRTVFAPTETTEGVKRMKFDEQGRLLWLKFKNSIDENGFPLRVETCRLKYLP